MSFNLMSLYFNGTLTQGRIKPLQWSPWLLGTLRTWHARSWRHLLNIRRETNRTCVWREREKERGDTGTLVSLIAISQQKFHQSTSDRAGLDHARSQIQQRPLKEAAGNSGKEKTTREEPVTAVWHDQAKRALSRCVTRLSSIWHWFETEGWRAQHCATFSSYWFFIFCIRIRFNDADHINNTLAWPARRTCFTNAKQLMNNSSVKHVCRRHNVMFFIYSSVTFQRLRTTCRR